jgi:hypothetical protein
MRARTGPQPADGRLSRRGLLAALAAIVAAPAARAAAHADLPGWRQARWGMTEAELAAAFGDAIRRLDKPLDYNRLEVRQTIPRITLAGRPFIVLFQRDRASGRLAQVLVQYRGRNPTHTDSIAVFDALKDELGAPARQGRESDYSGSFPSYSVGWSWRFATTSVRLRYSDPNAEPYSGVRKELLVRYFPTAAQQR